MAGDPTILTINGGSSSIKFAIFQGENRQLQGIIERIGTLEAKLLAKDASGKPLVEKSMMASDHRAAAQQLIDWLGNRSIDAVGHRVVHGGITVVEHQQITPQLIEELKRSIPLDPAHLPLEIGLIETFGAKLSAVPQFACLDTAFHHDLPRIAQLLPIPRKYLDQGVRRFGFHGLSYTYLMGELRRLVPDRVKGRIIFAHLGSGASLAAVRDGKPIDTTMAFTPTAGIMMATRPGDLDPGLLAYLAKLEKLSPDDLDRFVNQDCGLKGVSAGISDMRDLLEKRAADRNSAEAVELFCYTAAKTIAALTASMGGLDTLVFAGGIGEHVPTVREEICKYLGYLGISLDSAANRGSESVISSGSVQVRVIPTDEEIVIVRLVQGLLNQRPA